MSWLTNRFSWNSNTESDSDRESDTSMHSPGDSKAPTVPMEIEDVEQKVVIGTTPDIPDTTSARMSVTDGTPPLAAEQKVKRVFHVAPTTTEKSTTPRTLAYAVIIVNKTFTEKDNEFSLERRTALKMAEFMNTVLRTAGYRHVGQSMILNDGTTDNVRDVLKTTVERPDCKNILVYISSVGLVSMDEPDNVKLMFSDTKKSDAFVTLADIDQLLHSYDVPERSVWLDMDIMQCDLNSTDTKSEYTPCGSYMHVRMTSDFNNPRTTLAGQLMHCLSPRRALTQMTACLADTNRTGRVTCESLALFLINQEECKLMCIKFDSKLAAKNVILDWSTLDEKVIWDASNKWGDFNLESKIIIIDRKRHPAGKSKGPPAEMYTVSVLAPTFLELAAVRATLDEEFSAPPMIRGDRNTYTFGRICNTYVILAHLPSGGLGQVSATITCTDLRASFPEMTYVFIVSAGGGFPQAHEGRLRLGDIVISNGPGLITFDSKNKSNVSPPSRTLTLATNDFETRTLLGQNMIPVISAWIGDGMARPELWKKPEEKDEYFTADNKTVSRASTDTPRVWKGPIASGYSDITSARDRDELYAKYRTSASDIVSAGSAATEIHYMVIKAISHYCDRISSDRNKFWEYYAIANAAAYFRGLMESQSFVLTASLTDRKADDGYNVLVLASTPMDLDSLSKILSNVTIVNDSGSTYVRGILHKQGMIVTCMPGDSNDRLAAALVVKKARAFFPTLKRMALVGTCGGVPFTAEGKRTDVNVGDVVFGTQKGIQLVVKSDGFSEYATEDSFAPLPARYWLAGLASVFANGITSKPNTQPAIARPASEAPLYTNNHFGASSEPCSAKCGVHIGSAGDQKHGGKSRILSGVIASTDTPVKSASQRALFARVGAHAIDCLSGVAETSTMDYIVVRGISHYSDSHADALDPKWNQYASQAAAMAFGELIRVRA